MDLTGRRVLVTGASRGIGRGLAHGFAAAGATVALVARSEAALAEVAAATGGTLHPADLTDPRAVAGLIARVEEEAGPVDVLVNNAGLSHVGHVLDRDEAEVAELVACNLVAPIQLTRDAVERMIGRGRGHVVNVSSVAAVVPVPGLAVYGATKAGLSQFTAGLRQDLRGLPIGLTLVHLGSVPTDLDDQSRRYPPIAAVADRSNGRDLTPLPVVVDAIVDAVKHDRRNVRLPRSMAALPALAEAPRRVGEWLFRGTPPRAGTRR